MTRTQISKDDARLLKLAYDSSDDDSDVTEDIRCRYPSKFCGNARVAKASGKLHRFCELHRRRANVNQKRWTAVRRQVTHKQGTMQMDPTLVATTIPNYYQMMAPATRTEHAHAYQYPSLNEDDIHILATLLGPTESEQWSL
jgi:hypothetical protein